VLFPILLSGCLHMDGFADFFDAFFQKKDRQEILTVMKDPHIGVWGVVGVMFCILLKWECLMIVPFRFESFLLAITLSRWAHVFLSYLQPYAGQDGGLGQAVAKKVGIRELLGASVFTLAVALILGLPGLLVFLIIALMVVLLGRFYKYRIGGITGDLIGATGEMCEIAAYMVILVIMHYQVIL
jgi:adenosylcobinamide-GDP ribazoletransferase